MKTIEQIVRLEIEGDVTKAEVVGEIVRCKDCVLFAKYDDEQSGFAGVCRYRYGKTTEVSPDYFCQHGRRKEE